MPILLLLLLLKIEKCHYMLTCRSEVKRSEVKKWVQSSHYHPINDNSLTERSMGLMALFANCTYRSLKILSTVIINPPLKQVIVCF